MWIQITAMDSQRTIPISSSWVLFSIWSWLSCFFSKIFSLDSQEIHLTESSRWPSPFWWFFFRPRLLPTMGSWWPRNTPVLCDDDASAPWVTHPWWWTHFDCLVAVLPVWHTMPGFCLSVYPRPPAVSDVLSIYLIEGWPLDTDLIQVPQAVWDEDLCKGGLWGKRFGGICIEAR